MGEFAGAEEGLGLEGISEAGGQTGDGGCTLLMEIQ
jgi:hypothetical protein